MAGSRLANKLQIKPGKTLVVLGAPPGYRQALGSLPQEVRLSTSLRGKADVVQAVFRTRKDLLARVPSLKRGLADGGILWICYPKLTASAAGELNRDVIWKALEPLGLRPVAIDETWSAMRFKVVG